MDSFSDKLLDHYHYYNTRLQDAGQGRDEMQKNLVIGVGNCQRTIRKVQDDEVWGMLMRRQSIDS